MRYLDGILKASALKASREDRGSTRSIVDIYSGMKDGDDRADSRTRH